MMRTIRRATAPAAALAVAVLVGGTGVAEAQDASPEVVSRLQSLLQEATRARARLERDNARLTREVEDLEKKVARLEGSEKKLQSSLNAAQNNAAVLEQVGEDWQNRYSDLRDNWNKLLGGCTESVYIMRDIERERADFVERLAARNASLAACAAANDELLALNTEILSRYEEDGKGGLFTSVAKREPFVKLSRVQLETTIDDYRYEAGDHAFVDPGDLPLIDDDDASQTIDGRWQCSLLPQPSRDGL